MFKKIKKRNSFVARNRGLHEQIHNNKEYIYKSQNIKNNSRILKTKYKASLREEATLYESTIQTNREKLTLQKAQKRNWEQSLLTN
jgi:hypothetical protein